MTSTVRLAVDAWAPDFAASTAAADDLVATDGDVNLGIEVAEASWAPVSPPGRAVAADVVFVDGVRRVDARVWVTPSDAPTSMAVCASWAAGRVRCDGTARVEQCRVERGLFATVAAPALTAGSARYPYRAVASDDPDALVECVQERMRDLEREVARDAGRADLLVVDGPLRGRQNLPNAIGYVKTHRVTYLSPVVADVIPALAAGQRTPLFVTRTTWSRYSWYLRLPLPGAPAHPWDGVVRCEASADLEVDEARRLADAAAATLPRFASTPHRDPRAPQNLLPIAGLERELKHRLGDPALLYRSLRAAVASSASTGGATTV